MSSQAALAYVERIRTDAAFRQRVDRAPNDDVRAQIARDAGFDVNPDDNETIVQALSSGIELTDTELEKVAGGVDGGNSGGNSYTIGIP